MDDLDPKESNRDFQLDFKPFIEKKGQKYRVIVITDIQVHSDVKRPTNSLGKVSEKGQSMNIPYRAYTSIKDWNVSRGKQKEMILEMLRRDSSYIDFVKKQEEQGYKILLEIPDPIPLLLGKDTKEFLNSKKGKRIIRWISKNK